MFPLAWPYIYIYIHVCLHLLMLLFARCGFEIRVVYCACFPLTTGVCLLRCGCLRVSRCARVPPAFVVTWPKQFALVMLCHCFAVLMSTHLLLTNLLFVFLWKLFNCGCPVILASREKLFFPPTLFPQFFLFSPSHLLA